MPLGRSFETASVGLLLNKLVSQDVIDYLMKWKIDSSLFQKLNLDLLHINAILNHAEEKQFSDPDVKAWLEEVKDVRYDAEDIIDEIATGVLESRNSPSKVRNFLYDSVNASDSVKEGMDFKMKDIAAAINPFKQRLESRMNGIVGRLEDIVRHKDILNLKEDVGVKWSEIAGRTPTTPMFDESCVYGRDSDKEQIMKLLQSGQGDKVHVIPIVGLGGIGKTTLARIVYSEKIVKDPFTLKAWACVSDEFDAKRITRTLVESITRKTCKITNLDLLQEKLKNLLEGKKFLLVLDDVWNEIYENWDNLKILFTKGAPGSRIVVTTRSEKVASIMGTLPTHYLKELSKEDCISLFEQIVFPNGNSDAYPKLKDIGEKIVSRCGGLPLAVKALGGLLRFEFDASLWENILHSKMWKLPDNKILPALSLSYRHLPVHLKRCFAYCSMFPKDFEFGNDRLILLWMAEGFIQQPQENESMEDVGHKYFSALVSRSFFQVVGGDKSRFVMHDLIHDLAQSVSGKTCLRFEGKMDIGNGNNKYYVPVKTRHFSYTRGFNDSLQKFEPLSKVDCLRTFLPLHPLLGFHWSGLSNKVPSEMLPKFKLLRVLSLSGYEIVKLPDFIADLKHLRFLDLSYSQIKELPESTNSLYNLQTLILVNCHSLRTLPTDVGSLTNLRYLDIHGTSLEKMPLRMGRLTNLQFLSNFVVGTGNSSGIRELEDLSNLHGTLTILGLHNVTNIKDAIQAKLETKKNLDELVLEWISINDSRDEAVETEVFDVLQPHESLKKLTIKYYGGIEFPSWMGDPSFTNMVCLHLYGCKNCTLLPPLGRLLSLKDLSIGGMDGVKHVGAEFVGDADPSIKPFPVLEILNFEDMKQWEEWSFENGVEGFPCLRQLSILRCPVLKKFSHRFPSLEKLKVQKCVALESFTSLSRHENLEYEEFPCLRWLIIGGCTKLIELPDSLPSLEALEIDDCLELAAFPRLVNLQKLELLDSNAKLLGSMVDFSSLTSLHIRQISFVKCLPACMIKQFGKLENLKIVGCDDFEGLSNQGGLEDLASLQHLTISHCPKLVALPDEDIKLLPKLKLLDLSYCHNLIKLPCELQKVKSLLELKIDWCPKLEWFPEQGLPARLQRLIIRDCGALKTLPKKMLQNNTALEYLEINKCSSLTSLLEQGDLPTTLKYFRIYHCKNLASLPDGIMCKEKLSLERLEIDNCFSLSSFPAGELPTALKRIEISECAKLKSLPASLLNLVNLDSLEISGCNTLQYFPTGGLPSNLRSVTISQCEKLESLPERIHMLKFLQELEISYCPSLKSLPRQGLPKSLISLTIRDCEKLNPINEWKLHKLTSLETFNIGGVPHLVFFPDEYPLAYSITYLGITNMPDLESLSEVLKNLSSLETLLIRGCKKLYSLAENGIPSSLADLTIRQCPLLKPRCEQDKGDMWPKLECIPYIELSE